MGDLIQMPTREGWVTKAMIAEHFGVSERWIEQRVQKDKMPSWKVGRTRRFRVSDVEDWLRKRSA